MGAEEYERTILKLLNQYQRGLIGWRDFVVKQLEVTLQFLGH